MHPHRCVVWLASDDSKVTVLAGVIFTSVCLSHMDVDSLIGFACIPSPSNCLSPAGLCSCEPRRVAGPYRCVVLVDAVIFQLRRWQRR